MSFLNHVNGQQSTALFNKLDNFLLSQTPDNHKRLYNGFVIVPLKFFTSNLLNLIQPIEQIFSGSLHLIGAVFSKHKREELHLARDFFVIELPFALIVSIFKIATSSFMFLGSEFMIILNKAEPYKNMVNLAYQATITSLLEDSKDAKNSIVKRNYQIILPKLINNTPLNYKESVVLNSLSSTLSATLELKLEAAARLLKINLKTKYFKKKTLTTQQNAANYICYYALKHHLLISKKTCQTIQSIDSSNKEIKENLDPIYQQLKKILSLSEEQCAGDLVKRYSPTKKSKILEKVNVAWQTIESC